MTDSPVCVSSVSSSCCVDGPGEGCSPGQNDGAGGCCDGACLCVGPSSARSALCWASSCAEVLLGSAFARGASESCPSVRNGEKDRDVKHSEFNLTI